MTRAPAGIRRPALAGLVLLVGAIAAAAGFWIHAQRLEAIAMPIDALWAAEFKDLAGLPVKMSTLKGQPLVVNFWATWCGPCIEEMPDFQRASQTDRGKKVKFVGIGIDYAKNMKPFADKMGISYILLESGAQGLDILKSVGNTSGSLPFTLIIDRDGKVLQTKMGKLEYADLMSAIDRF